MKYSYRRGVGMLSGLPNRRLLTISTKLTLYILVVVSAVIFGMSTYHANGQSGSEVLASSKPQTSETVLNVDFSASYQSVSKFFSEEQLQEIVKTWQKSHKGQAGVILSSLDGSVLAHSASDKSFPMASIYKLYVAYYAYQKVDSGEWSLDEDYLNGWSRGKCLEEMIRSSNNECGEKMAHEIGFWNLQQELNSYGLKNTSLNYDFASSAKDSQIVLRRIFEGKNISQNSRNLLMSSMQNQIYRGGIPSGFIDQAVYGKVGTKNNIYNDASIVTLSDGRVILLSIFSKGVGTQSIAELSMQLSGALN
jgi:beta-lactamase class A